MTWGFINATLMAACRGASLRLRGVDQRPKIGIAVGFNEQIRQQTQRIGWRLDLANWLAFGLGGQVGILA